MSSPTKIAHIAGVGLVFLQQEGVVKVSGCAAMQCAFYRFMKCSGAFVAVLGVINRHE